MYLHYLAKTKHHISYFYNALLKHYPLPQVHQVHRKQIYSHTVCSTCLLLAQTQSSVSDFSKLSHTCCRQLFTEVCLQKHPFLVPVVIKIYHTFPNLWYKCTATFYETQIMFNCIRVTRWYKAVSRITPIENRSWTVSLLIGSIHYLLCIDCESEKSVTLFLTTTCFLIDFF